MVGRLVEEQDIRLGKQNLRQFDAHIPSLAECLCRTGKFLILESQTHQSPFSLNFRRVRLHHRKPVIHLIKMNNQVVILL